MDISIKNENECKSVFVSKQTELTEIFTKLWMQVINEKEKHIAIENK
ncbi:MAG: hypothetical protein NC318_04955 [Blautia sp.]|nr:hypothetical protein [Lachnoclostridium sp.]MCM1210931.1 hypothetical protein [Blautia sp.]